MVLERIVETLEGSAVFFMLSMIIVGIPAIVLKLVAIGLVRPETVGGRGKLIWRSVRYSAAAGAVAILTHTILMRHLGPAAVALSESVWIKELATAAALLVCVAVAEWKAWGGIAMQKDLQAVIGGWAWFLFGNAWIFWSLWLMHQAAQEAQLYD